jgi:hypothetical protein
VHGEGKGLMQGESSGASISDHRLGAGGAAEGFRTEGYLATKTRGDVRASSSRCLSVSESKAKKWKGPAGEGSSRGGALHPAATSARDNGCGCSSAMAKASKVLSDGEAGTSRDFQPKIRKSFLQGRYFPSTGMEVNEWQIILRTIFIYEGDCKGRGCES